MAKRRPSGDGMVRKREDGRWEGRIVVGHKQNGEPIWGSHGGVVAPGRSGRVKSTYMALFAPGLAGYNETHVQRKLCMGLAFLSQTKSHTGRKERSICSDFTMNPKRPPCKQ